MLVTEGEEGSLELTSEKDQKMGQMGQMGQMEKAQKVHVTDGGLDDKYSMGTLQPEIKNSQIVKDGHILKESKSHVQQKGASPLINLQTTAEPMLAQGRIVKNNLDDIAETISETPRKR
jgi:hypothetical protein